MAQRAIAGDVGGSEVVDEGASCSLGLGEGEPGKGLVAAPEDGVVGELSEDRVVIRVGDQGRTRPRELERHAVHDPVAVDVLAVQVRTHALESDAVVQSLQTVVAPAEVVLLDEGDGPEGAVNFEGKVSVWQLWS